MDCPSTSVLRQLCLDHLADDQAQALIDHIELCRDCQAAIDSLAGDQSDAGPILLAAAREGDSQLLQAGLADLKARRPASDSDATLQYRDLAPWIDDGDAAVGRVQHYDLVRCLGRGGMGVVFEAFDSKLQRVVALKMMGPSLLIDPASSERFLREARAAAAIAHPNVVAIHEVSSIRELPFLVMEYISGESLQARLDRESPLEIGTVVDIATQVATALAAAHEKGLIHRDVKPANILIQEGSGLAKLTDFGLAQTRSGDRLTQSGTLLGTPEYLAPEQINGGSVDHRSDLFSLGSVIYRMCSDRPPFSSDSIVATLQQVAATRPIPLRRLDSRVPAWLSSLVERLQQKKPEDRPLNAKDVSATLSGETATVATPPSQRVRLRSLKIGIVVAALACVVAITTIFLPHGEAQPSPASSSAQLIEFLSDRESTDLVVELTSRRAYQMPPLRFDGRSIKLIAGPGIEPTLVFNLAFDDVAISCRDSRIDFEGVRIEIGEDRAAEDEEEADFESLLSVVDGSVSVKDCSFDAGDRPCIELVASDATLIGSTFVCATTAVVCEPSDASTLLLEDCSIRTETGIEFPDSVRGTLQLNNTVFETESAVEILYDVNAAGELSIDAGNSRFDCERAAILLLDVESRVFNKPMSLLEANLPFHWQGADNHLPKVALLLVDEEMERERRVSRSAFNKLFDQ